MTTIQNSFFTWVGIHAKLPKKQFIAAIKNVDDKVLNKFLKSVDGNSDKVAKKKDFPKIKEFLTSIAKRTIGKPIEALTFDKKDLSFENQRDSIAFKIKTLEKKNDKFQTCSLNARVVLAQLLMKLRTVFDDNESLVAEYYLYIKEELGYSESFAKKNVKFAKFLEEFPLFQYAFVSYDALLSNINGIRDWFKSPECALLGDDHCHSFKFWKKGYFDSPFCVADTSVRDTGSVASEQTVFEQYYQANPNVNGIANGNGTANGNVNANVNANVNVNVNGTDNVNGNANGNANGNVNGNGDDMDVDNPNGNGNGNGNGTGTGNGTGNGDDMDIDNPRAKSPLKRTLSDAFET
jgi:hypothetical protein